MVILMVTDMVILMVTDTDILMVTDTDIILFIKDIIDTVVDKYLSLIQKALLIGSGAFL